MTKPLDPEIKALRAMVRAWQQVPIEAQERAIEWFCASIRAKIREQRKGSV